MRIKIFIIFLFVSIYFRMSGVTIYLTKLNFVQENADVVVLEEEKEADKLLVESIRKNDTEAILKILEVRETISFKGRVVKSSLDAAELCSILQIDYLIYGFIEKTNRFYNAEIRLYDNSQKRDRKIFYVKSEIGDFKAVIEEIGYKFVRYMIEALGLTEYEKERKMRFGGFGVYIGCGYWFPLTSWWDVTTGIVTTDIGAHIIPITPFYRNRIFTFYISTGLYISYSFGITKPGFLKGYLNTLHFYIPVRSDFELFFNHIVSCGVAPVLNVDIIYQKKIYKSAETFTTLAFGLMTSLSYEYWFAKRKYAGIGVNNIFDFIFYNTMKYQYRIELYSVIRVPVNIRGKSKE